MVEKVIWLVERIIYYAVFAAIMYPVTVASCFIAHFLVPGSDLPLRMLARLGIG